MKQATKEVMKWSKLLYLFGTIFFSTQVFSQGNKPVKLRLSVSYFLNKEDDYRYILKSNSDPLQIEQTTSSGLMISTVCLFRGWGIDNEFDKRPDAFARNFYLVLNLPVADFYNSSLNVFNKSSAGGIGVAYEFGRVFTVLVQYNYGQFQKMTDYAYANQNFRLIYTTR